MKQAVIAYGDMVASGQADAVGWPFDLRAEAVCARDDEGEVVGLIVWRVYEDAPQEAWLQMSWVEYRLRKKGVYRQMFACLQDEWRKRNIRKVEAAVKQDNAAMTSAKVALGFEPSRMIYALELSTR
jgi:transposase